MLSYQHGYHAGNFADVLKHVILTELLAYLTQKDKPIFYLETHSGKGLYDLKDKQSEKTEEYKQGIQRVWAHRKQLPTVFKSYLQAVKAVNPERELRFYPGSPSLAIQALRSIDRAYCCELHPGEYEQLQHISKHHKKVHFSHSDGISALKSLLPPAEKRGLIFIDPAYELKEEYKTIPDAIKQVFPHFAHGVYCLWYPIVNLRQSEQLVRRMTAIGAKNTLRIELHVDDPRNPGMTGCGLWIINPPYTLAATTALILDALKTLFPVYNSVIVEG